MERKPIKRKPSTLVRKPLKKKVVKTDKQKKFAARKRKLEKERELWRSFGLVRPPEPRYVGLQGICWYLASRAVRSQEYALYGGLCVDGCGKIVERWEEAHCGHFQGAGSAATRFLRENLGLQNKDCNLDQKNGKAVQYSYGKAINQRYGEGTAERLIEASKRPHVLKEGELLEYIAYYKAILGTVDNSPADTTPEV